MKNLESELQSAIAKWLRARNILFCSSSAGMNASSIIQAARNKRQGYQKGFVDLFIYEARGTFHGLALEIKSPTGKGKLSEEQKEWHKRLKQNGYDVHVIDNMDQALFVIDCYLNQK